MHTLARHALRTLGIAALLAAAAGCGGDDNPYKPQPAWSGKKASLPAPPTLPSHAHQDGRLPTRSTAPSTSFAACSTRKDVTANPITITGYIVDSNVGRAPECAIHKTGKADPDKCTPEVPSFWISDNKGDMKGLKIRVVGWARNFAVICDAMKAYNKLKPGEQPKEPVNDDILNVALPNPLPADRREGEDHGRVQRGEDGRVRHGQRAARRRHGDAEDGDRSSRRPRPRRSR